MTQTLSYHQPDNVRFEPPPPVLRWKEFLIGVPSAIALIVAAAWFYEWFQYTYVSEFTRLASVAGYGVGVLFVTVIATGWAEVRSRWLGYSVAVVFASVALYACWTFWTQRHM